MPDDSALFHGRPYDPEKARQYYLRTRHLKGRRRGSGDDSSGGGSRAGPQVSTHKPTTKAAQIDALESKLDRLRSILAELVEKAKRRSGVDIKTPESSKSSKSKDSGGGDKKSDLTTAEKKEKARKAREDYDKKKPEKDTKTQSASAEIKALQEKIQDVKAQIQDAIEDARNKSKSQPKTAPKGR